MAGLSSGPSNLNPQPGGQGKPRLALNHAPKDLSHRAPARLALQLAPPLCLLRPSRLSPNLISSPKFVQTSLVIISLSSLILPGHVSHFSLNRTHLLCVWDHRNISSFPTRL